jgi:ubiquinone/menaquinone biosynthesis C-methylase UbiE
MEPATSLGAAATRARILQFYKRQAWLYDATRWLTLHGRSDGVRALDLERGESVLDLGCGTGLGFPLFEEGVGANGSITGVDMSAQMLRKARARIDRRGWRNVRLVEADVATLELGQRFDAVALLYALSMMSDWELVLANAARHVAARGRLVVLDFGGLDGAPALRSSYSRWLRANHTEPGRPYTVVLKGLFARVTEMQLFGGYARIVLASSRGS